MEESCFPVTDPIPSNLSLLYTFSKKYICVLHDHSIHIYKLTENKWYCTSCIGNCPTTKVVTEYQQIHDIQTRNHEYRPLQFPTITTNPIPHTYILRRHENHFRNQITQVISVPEALRSSVGKCLNGFRFQLAGSASKSKGNIVYTESDVIALPNHQGVTYFIISGNNIPGSLRMYFFSRQSDL